MGQGGGKTSLIPLKTPTICLNGLAARPKGSDPPQTCLIARSKSLRQIDKPALVPDDFILKDYPGNAWGLYRGEQANEVGIHFDKAVAEIVIGAVWHQTQADRRYDDGVTLLFRIDGLNEIVRWFLGWLRWSTVIQPEELRDLVVGELAKAQARRPWWDEILMLMLPCQLGFVANHESERVLGKLWPQKSIPGRTNQATESSLASSPKIATGLAN